MLNHTSTTVIARTLLLAGLLLAVIVLAARTFLPAFAQEGEDDAVTYLEGSEHVVATFAATDPDEGDTLTLEWDLLDSPVFNLDGNANTLEEPIFKIENGRLTFASPPDYESPWITAATIDGKLTQSHNTYTVTVEVSDEDPGDPKTATTSVTVKVTNRDEDGSVEFNTLQPLEDVQLVATLTDPDGKLHEDEDGVVFPIDGDDDLTTQPETHATTTWKWARSMDGATGWVDIVATTTANPMVDINTRVPEKADVGYYLRATATYNDGQGKGKTEPKVTANAVGKNLVNDPPVFVHSEGNEYVNAAGEVQEDHGLTVGQPIASSTIEGLHLLREIDENSGDGADVGDGVTAFDDDEGALTYSIEADNASTDDERFEIGRGHRPDSTATGRRYETQP